MHIGTPLSLSDEFNSIIDTLEHTADHYFITGKAGTGKSTLLSLFRSTTKKKTVVLAPTGIAALNVKGQTIHSFFGFPPRMIDKSQIKVRKNSSLYKKVETIIIDEISMVRADMLDNIDYFLRINRKIDKPFGGVQMLFFGDLFQLPPVVASPMEKHIFKSKYTSSYFFASEIVASGEFSFTMIELNKVYRQDNRHFIRLLDNIRLKEIDEDDLMTINERYIPVPPDDEYTLTICSINKTANSINQLAIQALETRSYIYQAKVTGNFKPSIFPTEMNLHLKVGAQVMFVKNDPQRRYANGTIGIVEDLGHYTVRVRVQEESGREESVILEQEEWEILKYKIDEKDKNKIKSEVTGTFVQYPIKLAWAITIHKSQGKTYNRVVIDMGRGAFEYGQTYVALSRCRSLEGIFLKKPLRPQDILVDDTVRDFYQHLRYYS